VAGIPLHKSLGFGLLKGLSPCRGCWNIKISPSTLNTTLEFWCSDIDFSISLYKQLYCSFFFRFFVYSCFLYCFHKVLRNNQHMDTKRNLISRNIKFLELELYNMIPPVMGSAICHAYFYLFTIDSNTTTKNNHYY